MNQNDPNIPRPLGASPAATVPPLLLPTPAPGTGNPYFEPSPDNFSQDFRRFFVRGLAALMPTLITLWLLFKVWDFLWQSIGVYIIMGLRRIMWASNHFSNSPALEDVRRELSDQHNVPFSVQFTGVLLSIVLVYLVGLFVGNLIGRSAWRLAERAVMRVPLIRAIYPAVKQVTDFVLADKSVQFAGSRVVAVEPHAKGIWSIGLITGAGLKPISDALGTEMITVFVPSSPTAFSGYVLVVPRDSVIELPMSVEQAMRLLISGGVIDPKASRSGRSKDVPVAPDEVIAVGPPGQPTDMAMGVKPVQPSPTARTLPRAAG